MKKQSEKEKRIIIYIAILMIILLIILISINFLYTGSAIKVEQPKQHGLTSTQKITIDAATTQQLCIGKTTTSIAATLTDAVNKYQGGWQGVIKDALGVPNTELPDIYGALAYMAGALDDAESTKCLNQIGKKSCDKTCGKCKPWNGDLLVAFYRASSCRISDCEYWNSKVRYVGSGTDCTAELGCVFSNYPKTGQLAGCYI